ncbi:hypothetical protein NEUTE1DRAFT_118828 [Neurospora tetrasperma FGSC 2508]|uniref:Uncharacterized protein n=1 Tax=Neurospora tetrasperma (strain FGSC 2508 / ATCC MYA-4615 / P0657) TaxID=510951 RepID=F8N334_NEUT8|nr:uncharacterized protein NEUTE1DRAFT_118828 [Neurospora tetrasperma FGSC 2508]EGO52545.1 hypothetical protein NEUTE1DRAFT_118828 [Neurospora tetrasperma FGSC 2508]
MRTHRPFRRLTGQVQLAMRLDNPVSVAKSQSGRIRTRHIAKITATLSAQSHITRQSGDCDRVGYQSAQRSG